MSQNISFGVPHPHFATTTATTSSILPNYSTSGYLTATTTYCTYCGTSYVGSHLCAGMLGVGKPMLHPTAFGIKKEVVRYHPNVRCRKCSSRKRPEIVYCDGTDGSITKNIAGVPCMTAAASSEHLHLKCSKCKYEWLMFTADKELPEDEQDSL